MKHADRLEPGVLQLFRSFIGVRLAFLALSVGGYVLRGGNPWAPLIMVSVLDATLLFLYLSLPTLRRRLGGYYLPLGIFWATLGPIITPHLTYLSNRTVLSENAIIVSAWQLITVLFIPLVVIAWQYSFRHVVVFCVLTALADLLPLLPMHISGQMAGFLFPIFGVVMVRTLTFLLVGNMIYNMMKIQREQREELTQANHRLARSAAMLEQLSVSRERNRLAREMHDVLAHTLSSLAVELEAVKALWEVDSARAQTMLDHSLHATRDGLTETRRALQELRASPLEDMGLALAVRSLAEAAASRDGLRLDLHIEERLGDLPEQVQQCVYRVTQEALANIHQHATAGCLAVTLTRESGPLESGPLHLTIQDDGRGFDLSRINEQQQFGLRGMRERVEMIGGSLLVESAPGQGTKIALTYGGSP